MLKKLLSVSILLSASLGMAMDQRPRIVLQTIKNQNEDQQNGNYFQCRLGSRINFKIGAGESRALNMELFPVKAGQNLPLVKKLTLEDHNLMGESFRSYTLKLEMQEAALKITKKFGGRQDRPEETHALEAGKRYVLNVTVQPGDDKVVAELVEDNN
jgi:hypothetical protein